MSKDSSIVVFVDSLVSSEHEEVIILVADIDGGKMEETIWMEYFQCQEGWVDRFVFLLQCCAVGGS